MTYTMTVTFLCEGCGATHTQNHLLTPTRWTREHNYGERDGWHRCPSCSERVAAATRAALRPVEQI